MALEPASTDFIGSIRDALGAAGMLDDQIIVLNPNSATDGKPTLLLGPRPAYIKAISANVVTEAGLLKGIVRYRVQFMPKDGDLPVSKGMVVRVIEGGANPLLAHFALSVLGQPTGSIAALSKLECQTTGQPAPPWVAS